MSSIFICSDSQIKELVLQSLKGAEREGGLDYHSFLNNLKKEAKEDIHLKIRNGKNDFAPSALKIIDRILWQLINEQKLIINLSALNAGNIMIQTFTKTNSD